MRPYLIRLLKGVINSTLIYFVFLSLASCEVSNGQENFKNFKNNFPKISIPTLISDSIAFLEWPTEKLIDTNLVIKFGLVNKFLKQEYHYKSLKEYQCSYWGRYDKDSIVILIYKTFTTEAGRGNPQLILTTYSIQGIKKDEVMVLWNDPEDPLYSNRITLSILSQSKIEISSLEKTNGYLNEKIVPKRKSTRILKYSILGDGKIKLTSEKTNLLFINKDPNILDDFPSN